MENFTNKVKDEKSKILNFEYEAAFFFAWLSKGNSYKNKSSNKTKPLGFDT